MSLSWMEQWPQWSCTTTPTVFINYHYYNNHRDVQFNLGSNNLSNGVWALSSANNFTTTYDHTFLLWNGENVNRKNVLASQLVTVAHETSFLAFPLFYFLSLISFRTFPSSVSTFRNLKYIFCPSNTISTTNYDVDNNYDNLKMVGLLDDCLITITWNRLFILIVIWYPFSLSLTFSILVIINVTVIIPFLLFLSCFVSLFTSFCLLLVINYGFCSFFISLWYLWIAIIPNQPRSGFLLTIITIITTHFLFDVSLILSLIRFHFIKNCFNSHDTWTLSSLSLSSLFSFQHTQTFTLPSLISLSLRSLIQTGRPTNHDNFSPSLSLSLRLV